MWTNLSSVVGAAIQQVQKIQTEIESQMDEAVGANPNARPASTTTISAESSVHNQPLSSPSQGQPQALSRTGSNSSEPEQKEIVKELSINEKPTEKTDEIVLEQKPPERLVVKPKKEKSVDNSKFEKETASLKEKITDLTEENAILLERNVQHEEKIRNFSQVKKKLDENNAAVNNQLSQLQQQNDKLKERLKKQEQEILSLQNDLQSTKDVLSQTNSTLKEEKSSKLKLVEEKKSLELRVQQLNETIDKIQESVAASRKEESTGNSSDAWIEERNLLEIKIQKISDENGSLQQSLAAVQREATTTETTLKEEIKTFEAQIQQLTNEIKTSQKKISDLENDKSQIQSQWNEEKTSLTKKNKHQEDEITKIQEVLKERERALETSTLKASEMYKQCDDLNRVIHDLKMEIQEKDSIMRQTQTAHIQENEIKKELARLNDLLKEKDEKLLAFEEEGTKLAKKQSEMEKLVRKSRTEVKDKETEITKLKESRDQLVKAVEQTQDALKKQELENNNLTKTLAAMNAVSQATSDKINKLENELHGKNEEFVTQRKALENSWNENNESKRLITELRAERDDLRRQIGEGTTKVMESEGFRRDIEQREAVLKATSMQLQESLRNQMSESIVREERLREEINDLRKKWQEAVSSRETLSSQLSTATAPLLRQITTLQETLRIRSEQWQAIESQLTERLLRAENINETFEQKKLILEEQISQLKQQHQNLQQKYQETVLQLQSLQSELEKVKKNEMLYLEERDELEKRWNEEHLSRQSAMNTIREMELKFKIERQELHDSHQFDLSQRESEIKRLQQELNSLSQTLEENHIANPNTDSSPSSGRFSNHHLNGSRSQHGMSEGKMTEKYSYQDELSNLNLASKNRILLNFNFLKSHPLDGERSFIANEKLNIRNQQKEEEIKSLQSQINQLQVLKLFHCRILRIDFFFRSRYRGMHY